MPVFGADLQKFGTPWLYTPRQPAVLWLALGLSLAILVANVLLQSIGGLAVVALFLGGDFTDQRLLVKGSIIGILPASLLSAWIAWQLAKVRGGIPQDIFAMRKPELTGLGWLVVVDLVGSRQGAQPPVRYRVETQRQDRCPGLPQGIFGAAVAHGFRVATGGRGRQRRG